MNRIRPAAVAGSWYPDSAAALAAAVDRHLAHADRDDAVLGGELVALVAPHAGLMYSGPVAAHAYRLLRGRPFEVAVLVGPSTAIVCMTVVFAVQCLLFADGGITALGTNVLNSVGGFGFDDVYLVKYDPSGAVLWALGCVAMMAAMMFMMPGGHDHK